MYLFLCSNWPFSINPFITTIKSTLFCFSYAVRTNPADVARVESKTIICTDTKNETIPTPKDGVKGEVGQWADPAEMEEKLGDLFKGCMKGKY